MLQEEPKNSPHLLFPYVFGVLKVYFCFEMTPAYAFHTNLTTKEMDTHQCHETTALQSCRL